MKSKRLGVQAIYNVAGTVVPLLITIVTIPLFLRAIGDARFGALSLIWLLFGYFGLFDFGLSRATANRLAQLRDGDKREFKNVFYTALLINCLLGLLAGLVFFIVASPLLNYLLGTSAQLGQEVPLALPWIAALFPLSMVGSVFVGSLEAEGRFLELNLQQIVGMSLMQCLPLLIVSTSGASLQHAVIGTSAARVVSVSWLGVIALKRNWSAGRPSFSIGHASALFRYGGWITVTNGINPILVSVDQFLIGSLLGAKAVAHYSIPFSMGMKALILPTALARAMFPRFSSVDEPAARALADRAIITLGGLTGLVCVPGILLAGVVLELWVGAEFAHGAQTVTQIILVGTWINGLAFVPYALLQARGRPDIVAKFHALQVLPFVGLLWLGIVLLGLPGAALAWCLRVTLDAGMLFWAAGYRPGQLKPLLWPGSLVAAAWAVATLGDPGPILSCVYATFAMSGTAAWILIRDPNCRGFVRWVWLRLPFCVATH